MQAYMADCTARVKTLGLAGVMAPSKSAVVTQYEFESFDGVRLAYHVEGEGRPVVMLHGFLASARLNWIEPGVANSLARAGFQAIMPDLRGHGRSSAPDDAALYPADVLAQDGHALVVHLQLADYDLVGYSLGARTAVRMLVRGAKPRRCVLGGMGDSGVIGSAKRVAFFEDVLTRGESGAFPDAARRVHALMARAQVSAHTMLHVLRSQVQTLAEELQKIETPILVVSGSEDNDNGSAEGLASLLPRAQALRTPGNHLSAVGKPEFAAAMTSFLREG
jgi:pimeloyl-ACP methyl ester carboxylesterase